MPQTVSKYIVKNRYRTRSGLQLYVPTTQSEADPADDKNKSGRAMQAVSRAWSLDVKSRPNDSEKQNTQ